MSLLIKPEPFSQEFDRLFTRMFDAPATRSWVPPIDLVEAEDHFVLKADLPGLAEEDISLEVQDGTLTLAGERKAEHEQREKNWTRLERSYGKFSRSLTLPDGIDPDAVSAAFDRGVLTVRIPKPEERQPRRISIAAGNGNTPPAVEGTATETG